MKDAATKTKKQEFRFARPGAMTVQLVGDFTDWRSKPIGMTKGPGGVWRAQVELTPGVHHYRFLVDGEWQDDPECTLRIPNPYGTQNAVVNVA